jgi:hypothetical protein
MQECDRFLSTARDGVEMKQWFAIFVGDKYNEAWALVDADGNEREPSYWYNSKEEAEANA